jgi:hypothetical protein
VNPHQVGLSGAKAHVFMDTIRASLQPATLATLVIRPLAHSVFYCGIAAKRAAQILLRCGHCPVLRRRHPIGQRGALTLRNPIGLLFCSGHVLKVSLGVA